MAKVFSIKRSEGKYFDINSEVTFLFIAIIIETPLYLFFFVIFKECSVIMNRFMFLS